MVAVQVQYTVRPEYVERNKSNIRKVMDRLKADPIEGMYYASFNLEDGQTFVHINMAKDDDTMARINDLQEFNEFRMQLKASIPINPPKPTKLNPVAAGFNI